MTGTSDPRCPPGHRIGVTTTPSRNICAASPTGAWICGLVDHLPLGRIAPGLSFPPVKPVKLSTIYEGDNAGYHPACAIFPMHATRAETS